MRIVKRFDFVFLFFIFVFFVYVYTLYGIGGRVNFGDSAKWQFIFNTNYITHPTGYPLYLFLSKIFNGIFLFLTPQALRINLMSLFFGMLSLVFMYKVAYILTKSKVFSLIPVFTMAFTFSFWSQSTEAEVYTLNSFFLTFTLYNFLMFYQEKKRIYLYVGILFYAISFGNHLSMLFLLPGLVYVIYITDKLIFKDIKVWIFSFVSVVLGASEYLYIWGRFKDYYNENLNAIWKEGEVYEYVKNSKSVYDAFFSYITGGQFKQEFFQGFQYNITLFPKIFGGEFFLNTDSFFGYVVVMFLITTLIVFLFYGLFYFKKIVIYTFYIVFVSYSTFIFGYSIMDINVYFIPVYICLFLLITFMAYNFYKEKKYILCCILVLPFVLLSFNNLMNIKFMKNYDNYLIKYSYLLTDGLLDKNVNIFSPTYGMRSSKPYYLSMLFEYSNHSGDLFKAKFLSLDSVIKSNPESFYIYNFSLQEINREKYFSGYSFSLYKKYPSLEDVIEHYTNGNYTVIMTVNGDGYDVINSNIKVFSKLKLLGASFKDFCYGSSYILVIKDGKVVKEVASLKDSISTSIAFLKDKKYWTDNYKNNAVTLDLISSGYGKNCQRPSDKEKFGTYPLNNNIVINNKPLFLEFEGLHVLVLDDSLNPVLYNIYSPQGSLRDIYVAVKKLH